MDQSEVRRHEVAGDNIKKAVVPWVAGWTGRCILSPIVQAAGGIFIQLPGQQSSWNTREAFGAECSMLVV